MGKMPPVKRGTDWRRCHRCREGENGEYATCEERKRLEKIPHVQGGREWGICHLCREEENGEDATCAGREKMGRCHL